MQKRLEIVLLGLAFLFLLPAVLGSFEEGCGLSCCDDKYIRFLTSCDPGHMVASSGACCTGYGEAQADSNANNLNPIFFSDYAFFQEYGEYCCCETWDFCYMLWGRTGHSPDYVCAARPGDWSEDTCDYGCEINENCGYSLFDATPVAADQAFFDSVCSRCPPGGCVTDYCGRTIDPVCTGISAFVFASHCEQHLECVENSCEMVAGTGFNQCERDADCRNQHNECVGEQCVLVSGTGINQCEMDADCSEHAECRSGACVLVAGSGTNECASSADCQHTVCDGLTCIMVSRQGTNECTTSDDCAPEQHTECQGSTCITVQGEGSNQCATSTDCSHTECQGENCVLVDGSGSNQCADDSDCDEWVCESDADCSGQKICCNQVCIEAACYSDAECPDDSNPCTIPICNDSGSCNAQCSYELIDDCGWECSIDSECQALNPNSCCYDNQCLPCQSCVVTAENPILQGQTSAVQVQLLNVPNLPGSMQINCDYGTPATLNRVGISTVFRGNCGPYNEPSPPTYYVGGTTGFDLGFGLVPYAHCAPAPVNVTPNSYCGDGEITLPEQCDPNADPTGCAPEEECVAQGLPRACTCSSTTGSLELELLSLQLNPTTQKIGESLSSIQASIRNSGERTCPNGEIQLEFLDEQHNPVSGVDSLQRTFSIGDKETIIEIFSASNPPAPDTSSLQQGIYAVRGTVYCPIGTQHDQKIVYFSVSKLQTSSIPETNIIGIMIVLLMAILLLANKQKT